MNITKQYRCIHSATCVCTKGHLSEEVIFLVFNHLNWNPKLIVALSCTCKWLDDLAKRVLWKEFCKTRAPKMMLDLHSSGSHNRMFGADSLSRTYMQSEASSHSIESAQPADSIVYHQKLLEMEARMQAECEQYETRLVAEQQQRETFEARMQAELRARDDVQAEFQAKLRAQQEALERFIASSCFPPPS